jgi:hypothetical protein
MPLEYNEAFHASFAPALAKVLAGQPRQARLAGELMQNAPLSFLFSVKIQQQREYLETHLVGLQVYAGNKAGAAVR